MLPAAGEYKPYVGNKLNHGTEQRLRPLFRVFRDLLELVKSDIAPFARLSNIVECLLNGALLLRWLYVNRKGRTAIELVKGSSSV